MNTPPDHLRQVAVRTSSLFHILTQMSVEDDEAAKTAFQIWMTKQAKLPTSKSDELGISVEMKKTFQARRAFIFSGNNDISEVEEEYTLLFEINEMFREFKRLTTVDIVARYNEGLNQYAGQIVSLPALRERKVHFQIVVRYREEFQSASDPDERQHLREHLALLSPSLSW